MKDSLQSVLKRLGKLIESIMMMMMIQSLRAFRRPHLDAWMLGCLEDWRGIGWIGRIGESGGFGESGGLEGLVGLGGLFGLRGLGGFGSGRAFWYPKAPRNHRPDTNWTNF